MKYVEINNRKTMSYSWNYIPAFYSVENNSPVFANLSRRKKLRLQAKTLCKISHVTFSFRNFLFFFQKRTIRKRSFS